MEAKETYLQAQLLSWYDREGRNLPFRGTKDPYLIWVSEIMLQQTQTGTVAGYYRRFIERFPDVQTLAAASEQAVLKLWEGLGYYSRARNLHKAAKMVAYEMSGRMPRTATALQALPGIGLYTAAAIASIAYDEPVPAMDGNLTRVISRLYLVEEDVSIPWVRRKLHELGLALMPVSRAGDMNQALMDLGATLCVSGTPDCFNCPLRSGCAAYEAGEPERLPLLPLKKPPRAIPLAVVIITCKGKVLVTLREEALLRGLYVFHLMEHASGSDAVAKALRVPPSSLRPLGKARHVFTHRIWEMIIYHAEIDSAQMMPNGLWVTPEEMELLPFPTAMRMAKGLAHELLYAKEGP